MVELNNVEEALIKRMEIKADRLRNGGKGDPNLISEAVADLIDVFAAMVRTGGVSPKECQEMHTAFAIQVAKDRDAYFQAQLRTIQTGLRWPAILAYTLPICVTITSLILPIIVHYINIAK